MQINKSKINYRLLGSSDIDILIDYRIIFLKEIQKIEKEEDEKKLRKELKNYFTSSIKNNEYIGIVAEYKDQPIGFGGMVIQTIPGHFKFISGKQAYILNMYTIPEFRKKGICSKLLTNLITKAKELGLDKICLHATDDGFNIYKKRGFKKSPFPQFIDTGQ